MFKYYQPNPCGRIVGDCAVRAISAALNLSWEESFDLLTKFARNMCDMPSSDEVWGAVLRANGFYKELTPGDGYEVYNFCKDNPKGVFVLGLGGHVTTVIDGDVYDSWNTLREVPIYVWYMKGE